MELLHLLYNETQHAIDNMSYSPKGLLSRILFITSLMHSCPDNTQDTLGSPLTRSPRFTPMISFRVTVHCRAYKG